MTTPTSTPTCPTCGQPGIPIAYGLPSEQMWEAEAAGKIVLGGCEVWDGMPDWRCRQGHEWRDGEADIDGIAAVMVGRPPLDPDWETRHGRTD
ncbi:MAG: hypothetical protein IRY85_06335 [Micromonosporaceae bacterium]|jgi:hypothetical protein|nr:hypothetical protein [Micromonosporaceae bacterium]